MEVSMIFAKEYENIYYLKIPDTQMLSIVNIISDHIQYTYNITKTNITFTYNNQATVIFNLRMTTI